MKKFSLVLSLVLFTMGFAFAQRTVVGQITDGDGAPLIGATILVKGTDSGTVTDIDGKYSVNVPDGANTLELSYTGYETQEIVLGVSNVVNATLSEGVTLETAVVTALGVKRSEKALGYSVQQVGGDDIGRSGASNAVDALVGKAAGIQVTRSSGTAGGGSRILIRGVTSMVGDNQPLIVIDGVRTNNETQQSQAETAGTAVSNRLMDLNPDDIESINVLKGAAATALYGTSGASGVILITTKKGNKGEKFSVDFSSSVGFDNITNMIDLQNEYAQGWSGGYDDPSTGSSTSWGPRISELEYSTDPNHPNAPGANAFFADGTYRYDPNGFIVPKGTGNGQAANVYDNVTPFFQTGNTFNNSVAISGGSETATVRLSVSDRRENGIVPNNEYDRQTVKLSSSLSPTKDFTISGSVNYSKSEFVKIQQGSNTSGLLLGLLRTPATFDNSGGLGSDAVDNPSAYIFPDFRQRNYRGGGGYDNPYWTVNLAKGFEDVDRVFGNLQLNYQIDPWLNIGINSGYDIASDVRKQEFEVNSRTNAAGRILHDDFKTKVFDNYLNFTGNGNLTDDITFNYLANATLFSFNSSQNFATGDGLVFSGFRDMSNATQVTGGNDIERYRQVGFGAQVEAGFQNMLYLTLTARQDYDSRLGNPTDFNLSNTGFFYPSASLAWVFSEVLGSSDAFSFGKLRLSWAQVGAPPPDPYSTSSVFGPFSVGDGWGDNINFPIAGRTGFDNANLLGNPNLTPELSTTFEIGADLRFLRNRLGLDVTYYNRKTVDAILNASLPRSTGYANVWLNSGEMTSNGIEVTLNATPVSNKNFQWNSQVNFTKSESIVDKLAPGIERLFLAGFNTAGTYLVEGNQYGAIFGGAYLREGAGVDGIDESLNIPAGAVVINDNPDSPEYGFQAVDPTQRAIGNPNPDFIIGWNNVLSYKRFTANFLLDWREGGDLWNGTAWALSFFGTSQLTADTREETAAPIEGVKSDGTPNDIPVVRDQSYWTSSVGGFGAVGEQFVQDGGWVRLREVGLSYRLPDYGRLRGGSLGVSGRNLWFQTDYEGIDPETSLTGTGNGQGFDYFNMPSTRSVIVTLNLNF